MRSLGARRIDIDPPYRGEGLQKQAIEQLFQRHISLFDGCWDS